MIILALLLGACASATFVEGTPSKLPAAGLGSSVLLHALRAGLRFVVGLAAITILVRAANGALPSQMSTQGVSYNPAEQTTAALGAIQQQVDELSDAVESIAETVDIPTKRP